MNRKYFLAAAAAVVLIVACITRVLDGQNSIPTNSATPTPVSAFNGASSGNVFDPLRSLRAANTYAADGTSFPAAGALVAEKGARWRIQNNAVSGSAASASEAAASGISHVADCLTYSAYSNSTGITATAISVNLRDGASGAGTVIWTVPLGIPTTTAIQQVAGPFSICGLNLQGTTNTAMTLEFNTGVTNMLQGVTLSGYDVN